MRASRWITMTVAAVVTVLTVGHGGAAHDEDVHSTTMTKLAALDSGRGGDVAFWGDTAVLAHGAHDGDAKNDGFVLVDIADPSRPRRIGGLTCVSSGADVSVWGDLVFLSADGTYVAPADGTDCDADPVDPSDPDAFAGLRVVSIADPARPVQLAAVRTNGGGGSHNHTVLPDLDHRDGAGRRTPRLLVYTLQVAFTPGRDEADLVEVPLHDPAAARRVDGFQPPTGSSCHDLSVFVPRRLAFCAGGSFLWDVADPLRPRIVAHVPWGDGGPGNHSGAFSWDGNTLVVGDEPTGEFFAGASSCGTASPRGALTFYDVTNPALPLIRSRFQLPRTVVEGHCSAHQMNVVPLSSGRDVVVAGWWLGGTSVVDFTDAGRPLELAHYRASPQDPDRRSNAYASYWYKGRVYVNNSHARSFGPFEPTTERGLDVLTVDHPALASHIRVNRFSFGTQECLPPPHGAAHGSVSCATP